MAEAQCAQQDNAHIGTHVFGESAMLDVVCDECPVARMLEDRMGLRSHRRLYPAELLWIVVTPYPTMLRQGMACKRQQEE